MKALRRRLILMIAISCVLIAGCDEKFESHFPTAAAASEAGEFTRGWLPEVLRPDATDIYEWHDLDSNRGGGRFSVNPSLVHRIESDCQRTSKTEFRCDEFWISVDSEKGIGRFRSDKR
jgi:hypothetical protein